MAYRQPGVARFDFIQQTDDASRFVLVEAYRDYDSIAEHKLTAHYIEWAEKVAEMFAEPRTRALYQNVDQWHIGADGAVAGLSARP